jgi:ribosomal protein uL24
MRKRKVQRKAQILAPLHKKQDMMSAHVSKDLRKIVGKRSLHLKKGYQVKVLRGENKGKEGKVTRVFLKIGKINVEGISAKKADGKDVLLRMDPSNVLITKLEAEAPKASK